jgi:hypothetical protein
MLLLNNPKFVQPSMNYIQFMEIMMKMETLPFSILRNYFNIRKNMKIKILKGELVKLGIWW